MINWLFAHLHFKRLSNFKNEMLGTINKSIFYFEVFSRAFIVSELSHNYHCINQEYWVDVYIFESAKTVFRNVNVWMF